MRTSLASLVTSAPPPPGEVVRSVQAPRSATLASRGSSRVHATLLLLLPLPILATVGCQAAPTAEEAHALLRQGDAESALQAARRASASGPPEQRVAARRVAVRAALAAGLVAEAAIDYEHLRRDLGGDDAPLLAELGLGALKVGQASADPGRRLRALRAVEGIADDPRLAGLVRASLDDPREAVRAAAARLLARTGDRDAQAALARVAARDADPDVRRQALVALADAQVAHVTTAGGVDLLAVAGERLVDPDEGVRRAAMGVVGRALLTGGPRAVWAGERLVEALGRGGDAERLLAGAALLAADPARARAAWSAAVQRGQLPAPADGAPGSALEAFGLALAVHEPRAPLEAVKAALAVDAPYAVRLATVRGLVGPGAARLEAELGAALRSDPAQPVRTAALEALLAVGTPAAAARRCRAALSHEDPAVRRAALVQLERRAPLDVEALVALLERDDVALADEVARTLAARGGEAGWRALLAAAERGQLGALAALAQSGDPRLRPWLATLSAGADGLARGEALRGLTRAGAAEDRPLLVAALTRTTSDGGELLAAAALLAIDRRTAVVTPTSEQ